MLWQQIILGTVSVRFESWPNWQPPHKPEWTVIGAQTGVPATELIIGHKVIDFSTWTPKPIKSRTGVWGASVSWTSERDLRATTEFPERCTVRTYFPIGLRESLIPSR